VALGVTDPVTVADWHVLFRHTVRSLGEQLGYKASFSPITSPGLGNGCHLHFSLQNSARENLFSGGDRMLELTAEGEAFIAGVLAELGALVALACPTVLSYERLKPERWAGAFHGWGHENREVALRFIQGIVGQRSLTANMEFKAGDCAGHPYLVPGAIIAAGLNGIERGMTLPEPLQLDPVGMTVQDQAARDAGRLPSSLGRAADALEASEVLRAAMGDPLHRSCVVVRRAEAEADEGKSLEDMMRELLWRF